MKRIGLAVMVLALAVVMTALAGESKWISGTTSAALTFAPASGQTVVQSVFATTDKEDGAVKFYCRGTVNKVLPTGNYATSGAVTVTVANASYNSSAGYTTNDSVVYVHANGVCDYRTITNATATVVQLSSGLSAAGASGDVLYKVTQQGQIVVGFDGAAAGTNDTLNASGIVFVTPGDSPLYVVLDGTAACQLQVTVDK